MTKKAVLLTLLTPVILILISLPLSYSYKSKREKILSLQRKTLPPEEKTVNVSARVGGPYKITQITGWTSPFAEVTLESLGVASKKTIADSEGFFIFENINLPAKPNEICLISQDVNQLPSFPLCLPPPKDNQNVEITNILLSPSLSLETSQIPKGKTAKASGTTFPNSPIEVYFFIEKTPSLNFFAFLAHINPLFSGFLSLSELKFSVSAAEFPLYQIKSNPNGYFEFSLPSSTISKNRIFVTSKKQFPDPNLPPSNSPKSNTLFFQILSFWGILKLLISSLIQKLFSSLSWFLIIICLELFIIFFLIISIKKYHKTSENNTNTSTPFLNHS